MNNDLELLELRGPAELAAQLPRLKGLVKDGLKRSAKAAEARAVVAPIEDEPIAPYVLAALVSRVLIMENVGNARSLVSHIVKRYGDEGRLALAWLSAAEGEPPLPRVLLAELAGSVGRLPIGRVAPAILAGLASRKADVRAQAAELMLEAGERIRPALQAARKEASSARKKLLDTYLRSLDERAEQAAAPPVATTGSPVERALAAISAGDYASAALALRALWEDTRDPQIARLCEAASASVRAEVPALPTRKALASWWEATAQRCDPAFVPALLACAWPDDPKEVKLRASLLAKLPPDPRVATAAVEPLLTERYRVPYGNLAEEALMKLLAQHADPRYVSEVLASGAELLAVWGESSRTPSRRALLTGQTLQKALASARHEPPPSAEELARVRSAVATSPAARRASLLAAVLESPDDLAARSVYADFLSERGDPRGELIQVQLARASDASGASDDRPALRKRETSLLTSYGAEWAAELPCVRRPSVRFARGFVEEADLELPTRERRLAALFGAAGFRTLRRVGIRPTVGSGHEELAPLVARLLVSENFRGLTGLFGVPSQVMLPPHASLTELGLLRGQGLPNLSALPSLRRLLLGDLSACHLPFGAPIERLDLVLMDLDVTRLDAALQVLPASVREVRLVHSLHGLDGVVRPDEMDHLALARDADGAFRRATLSFLTTDSSQECTGLWMACKGLAARASSGFATRIAHTRIVVDRLAPPDPAGAERLRAKLALLAGLEVEHPFGALTP